MRSDRIRTVSGLVRAGVVGLLGLALSACFAIRNDYHGDRLMTPGTTLGVPSEVVGPVDAGEYKWSCLFGFVDLESSSGVELLECEADRRGLEFDGMTEIRIRDEMDLLTVVVTGLTLGLFTPWWVEGDATAQRFVEVGR
ncbi:MAG: hypothetical protein AAF196_12800 [Planctomycetota bacterium]